MIPSRQSPMGNQWPNENFKNCDGESLSCMNLKHAFWGDEIRTLGITHELKIFISLFAGL